MLCRLQVRLILRRRRTGDPAESTGQRRAIGRVDLVSVELARTVAIILCLAPTRHTAGLAGKGHGGLRLEMLGGREMPGELGLVGTADIAVLAIEFIGVRRLVVGLAGEMAGMILMGMALMRAGLTIPALLVSLGVEALNVDPMLTRKTERLKLPPTGDTRVVLGESVFTRPISVEVKGGVHLQRPVIQHVAAEGTGGDSTPLRVLHDVRIGEPAFIPHRSDRIAPRPGMVVLALIRMLNLGVGEFAKGEFQIITRKQTLGIQARLLLLGGLSGGGLGDVHFLQGTIIL